MHTKQIRSGILSSDRELSPSEFYEYTLKAAEASLKYFDGMVEVGEDSLHAMALYSLIMPSDFGFFLDGMCAATKRDRIEVLAYLTKLIKEELPKFPALFLMQSVSPSEALQATLQCVEEAISKVVKSKASLSSTPKVTTHVPGEVDYVKDFARGVKF